MGGVCFFFPIEHHCLVDDCYSLNINIVIVVVVVAILILVESVLLIEDGVAAVLAVTRWTRQQRRCRC